MTSAASANEETGWESVANVCFRDPATGHMIGADEAEASEVTQQIQTEEVSSVLQVEDVIDESSIGFIPAPPPQFDNSPPSSIETNDSPQVDKIVSPPIEEEEVEQEIVELMKGNSVVENSSALRRLSQQYVYGEEGANNNDNNKHQRMRQVVHNKMPTVKSSLTQAQPKENVIEAEIRAQQEREMELQLLQTKKQEIIKQNLQNNTDFREKGASSPHDSDEGFVDPSLDKHTNKHSANNQETGVYDAIVAQKRSTPTPPAPAKKITVASSTPTLPAAASNTTESKIALEIRELKEREDELKKLRDMRSGGKKGSTDEDYLDEELEERSSSCSSRDHTEDHHLVSLTTTTDEGNYSECGDNGSNEDKSSNGSNSRITSPEVPPVSEYPRPPRRVTVRPYQEEDEEQPVYTRMKNESVIEREIRLAKDRDDAFKREKGLLSSSSSGNSSSSSTSSSNASTNNNSPSNTNTKPKTNGNIGTHATLRQTISLNGGRDASQQLATSRIQMEIAEHDQKERELMSAGKVLTLSEDTVDDKVTRMADLVEISSTKRNPSSSASSSRSSSRQSSSPHSTLSNRSSGNSPFGVRSTTNGFVSNGIGASSVGRLTRSLSTTNLASPSSSLSGGVRNPKGFMEKFIASRGKMTPSAFGSSQGSGKVVMTRPMKVLPKAPVLLRQQSTEDKTKQSSNSSPAPSAPLSYKKLIGAEEKIQEELRDMQHREEELRQVRSRHMARSQPNLLEAVGLTEEIAIDEEEEKKDEEEGSEVRMRGASSNPNLLEDNIEVNLKQIKSQRRRSTLIAQWENRIQATNTVDA